MRAAVFYRYERVYYVLGYADDAKALAQVLQGVEQTAPRTTADRRIIYMERIASAPVHKRELMAKHRALAEKRAKEIPLIKEAP